MTTATTHTGVHGEIEMERTYNASPTRVFNGWADSKAREVWGRPSESEIIVYEKADFGVGGEDISRCGPKGDLRFLARVRYLEIIKPQRIVMAEHVSESGASRAAALVTVELAPVGKQTRLNLTLQISALDGPVMLEGYRFGWTAALDNLVEQF